MEAEKLREKLARWEAERAERKAKEEERWQLTRRVAFCLYGWITAYERNQREIPEKLAAVEADPEQQWLIESDKHQLVDPNVDHFGCARYLTLDWSVVPVVLADIERRGWNVTWKFWPLKTPEYEAEVLKFPTGWGGKAKSTESAVFALCEAFIRAVEGIE